mmetsp:Transcript_10033/g.39184  ORF Transcript_10033/g.39184 Transcript_10033/m.39184 type:complete len:398 (-) Transcript_10033:38-1231(-)
MGRTDYHEILDEAEHMESTKAAEVWNLDAEAARLNLKLDELPMEEKAWDRAVNVAYRKAALRAHPDKHPPEQRDAAEANFKRLNRANKLLLRVGKAIRDEAESGNAQHAIERNKRLESERIKREEARLASRLKGIVSLHGVSGGFTGSNGRLPDLETDASNSWTRGDLENQLIELLARCGEEFEQRAKRRRRWKLIKRVAAGVAGVAFLWFVRKTSPPERDYGEELREVAEGIRVAIRYMGRELAGAIGRPQDAEEMADDLEMAFLEGRMSVNDDGGLEVLIPDPDEDGTYYKLNMSSREDGTMAVWAEGAEGDVVEYNGDRWDDADDNRVGYFGIPVEQRARGTKGSVNFTSGDEGERGDDGGDVGGGAAKGSGGGGGGGEGEKRGKFGFGPRAKR